MIQRKQTLFLLLIAAIAAFCLFMNPMIGYGHTKNDFPGDEYHLVLHKLVYYTDTMIDMGAETLTVEPNTNLTFSLWVVLSLSLVSIFLFKNRKLQSMLVGFNFIFIAVVWFFEYYYIVWGTNIEEMVFSTVTPWAFFTAVLPISNWLALRGIIADERLVKSMDRLR